MEIRGVEYRTPMRVVQIGGVLFSTLFTLFVIPVVYTMADRFTLRGGRNEAGWSRRTLVEGGWGLL